MRRLPATLCPLATLAAVRSPGQPAARVLADYARLQQKYPRPEGSAAEIGVLRQAEQRLGAPGIPTRRLDFRESDRDHSFSEVLVASVRHPQHVVAAAKMGADVCTIPPNVLKQLYAHPLTDKGLAAILADWKKTGQSIL